MTSPQQPKRLAISELAGRQGDPSTSGRSAGPAGNGPSSAAPANGGPSKSPAGAAPHPPSGPSALSPSAHNDDRGYSVTLRDFLRSVYFYWRIGFAATVVVLVLGILWWSNQPTYSVAYSTIIKKNLFNYAWGATQQEEWDRTLETDLSLIHSEEVSYTVGTLIHAVSNMPNTQRALVLETASTDSEVIAAASSGSSTSGSNATADEGFAAGDDVLVIDVANRTVTNRAAALDAARHTLLLSLEDARVLVSSWQSIEQAGQAEPLLQLANRSPELLAGMVNVDGDPASGEIGVSSRHSDPAVASFLANVFPLAFMTTSDSWIRRKNRREETAIDRMLTEGKSELVVKKARLQDEERKVIERLVGPDGAPALGISGLDYDSMRERLGELQSRKRELQDRVFTLKREADLLETFYRQFADPDLRKIDALREQVRELSLHERADGPRLSRMLRTLDGLEEAYENREPNDFVPESNYMALMARRDATAAATELARAEGDLQRVTERERELRRVVELYPGEAAGLEPLHIEVAQLQDKVKELTALRERARVKSQRVPQYYQWKTTSTPGTTTPTSKSSWLFLIVLVALLSGLTMTRVAAVADTRVQTESHVRQITHRPTLLNLPVLAKSNRYIYRETASGRRTNSFIYNLFGILGVNIRHLGGGDHPEKLLCVTSAVPSEGKSFVAFNLAAYYALQGMHTCLLHCDYRHPTLEMFPDLDVDRVPGFIEYLAGNGEIDSIEECIYPTDIESLFVCLPGRITAPPIHLLDQPVFGEFLEDMQDRFDVVILDCAPLLLVVDTAIIARHARSTLLVAGMGVVKKNSLEMCIDRLNIQGINVIGSVINRDRMAAWNYYSHYYGDIVVTSVGDDYTAPAASGSGTWLATGGAGSQAFQTGVGSGTRTSLTPAGSWPTAAGGSRPSDRFNALLDATISSGRILIPGPDRESGTRPVAPDIGDPHATDVPVGTPVFAGDGGDHRETELAGSASGGQPVYVASHITSPSSRREPIVPQMDTLPRPHAEEEIPVAEFPSPLPDSPFAGLEPGPSPSVFDSTEVDGTDPGFETGQFASDTDEMSNTDDSSAPGLPPPPFNTDDDFHNLD